LETEIEEAALELFAERGFEAVTTDEIADAAAISRRTFFRYFGSKEELLFRDLHRRVDGFIVAFGERPADEPLLLAMRTAAMTMAAQYQADRPALMRIERIIAGAPGVLARSVGEPTTMVDTIMNMVAVRLDADALTDMRPAIITTTFINAFHIALRMWLSTPRADFPELAARALDLVEAGLAAAVAAAPTSR
jgi:AcrR family transcriptional regulator